jgi:hypothetical protein
VAQVKKENGYFYKDKYLSTLASSIDLKVKNNRVCQELQLLLDIDLQHRQFDLIDEFL